MKSTLSSTLIFIFAILLCSFVSAPLLAQEITVEHYPPDKAIVDKPLKLEFTIDPGRIKIDYALVFHRNLMTSSYKTTFLKPRKNSTDIWLATISYRDVSHPGIEYYAIAYDARGREYTLYASKDSPEMVKVVEAAAPVAVAPVPAPAPATESTANPASETPAETAAVVPIEPEIRTSEAEAIQPESTSSRKSGKESFEDQPTVEPEHNTVEQEDDLDEEFALYTAETEARIVSATKTEQEISRSPVAISVLESEDLRNYASPSFVDALRSLPGLDFMEISPADKNITARGFNREGSNKMLTLIDGRAVYVDLFGITFWEALPVVQDDIDRIEVIRGPGSVLYGTNAFSGVVNIYTKKPEDLKGFAYSLFSGPNGTTATSVYGDRKENLGYKISGGYHQLSSYDDRTADALESISANAYVDYKISKDFSFSLAGGANRTDAAKIFSLVGPVSPEATQTYVKLNGQWQGLKGQFYWSYINLDAGFNFPIPGNIVTDPLWFDPDYQGMSRDEWTEWREANILQLSIDAPESQNIHSVGHTADLELSYEHEFAGLDRIYAGGDVRIVTLDSPDLVDKSTQTNNYSLFLQNDLYPWEWFLFNAGVRWDMLNVDESGSEDIHNIAPRGALIFFPHKDHALRISGGAAFRNPAYFESNMKMRLADITTTAQTSKLDSLLTIPDVTREADLLFEGNSNLSTEKIYTAEFGYSGRFSKRVEVNADFFYNIVRDLILFNGDPEKLYWALNPFSPENWLDDKRNNPFNFNNDVNASALGFEVAARYRATSWLKLFVNYSFEKIWVDNKDELIDSYVKDKNDFYQRLSQKAYFDVGGSKISNTIFESDPGEIFSISKDDVNLDDITTVHKETPMHKANVGFNTSYKGFAFNLFGHYVSQTERQNFLTHLAHAEFLTFSYDKDRMGGWVRYEGKGPVAVYTKEELKDGSTKNTTYGLIKVDQYFILNANFGYTFWEGKMEVGLAMFDLLQFPSLWQSNNNNGFILSKKTYDRNGTSIPYRRARSVSSRYIQYPREYLFGETMGGESIPTRVYFYIRGKI